MPEKTMKPPPFKNNVSLNISDACLRLTAHPRSTNSESGWKNTIVSMINCLGDSSLEIRTPIVSMTIPKLLGSISGSIRGLRDR